MTNIKIEIGTILFNIHHPLIKFEVFKETPSTFYLAHCDGSCSKIDYISKDSIQKGSFLQKWAFTDLEALQLLKQEKNRELDSLTDMESYLKERKS